jgi:transposase
MADLSEAQWEYVRPFVERDQELRQRPDGRGGRWGDARRMLNGVLWILRTGAPWQDLPSRYGAYQSCHRRFQQWQQSGVLDGILWALCEDLVARGKLDLSESFVDASFSGAKRGRSYWSNALRQREQDHGNRGQPWSSCRRPDYKRFTE